MNNYIYLITGLVVGVIIGVLFVKSRYRSLQKDQESLLAQARTDAAEKKSNKLKEAQIEIDNKRKDCEDFVVKSQDSLAQEKQQVALQSSKNAELLVEVQKNLEDLSESKADLDEKSRQLNSKEEVLKQKELDLADADPQEIKNQLIERVEAEAKSYTERIYKQSLKEMKSDASEKARDILLSAMQRYSAECASDRTTTTIYLQSDDIKGRIIGRDGRNIRTLESLTGANIIIDDTPETVVISCFNSYRRELARITLEQLIDDGRIHPNRIHEVISSVTEQMDRDLERSATYLCEELNVGLVSNKIYRQLGMLKYRFNAFQNLMQHSREVASLMGSIAAEMGMDVRLAKRIGMLHAIGQSFDESAEENSAQMGADFLRREGEDEIICQAIENYKDTYTMSNGLDRLLHVGVQVSKNRPGTADEAMDSYVHRLHQIEYMMKNMNEVNDCVVMQAGREVLVSVNPEKVKDSEMAFLSQDIASRIETEMTLPGAVQVILSRDLRVEAIATP